MHLTVHSGDALGARVMGEESANERAALLETDADLAMQLSLTLYCIRWCIVYLHGSAIRLTANKPPSLASKDAASAHLTRASVVVLCEAKDGARDAF
jgi:hypothetical protein